MRRKPLICQRQPDVVLDAHLPLTHRLQESGPCRSCRWHTMQIEPKNGAEKAIQTENGADKFVAGMPCERMCLFALCGVHMPSDHGYIRVTMFTTRCRRRIRKETKTPLYVHMHPPAPQLPTPFKKKPDTPGPQSPPPTAPLFENK